MRTVLIPRTDKRGIQLRTLAIRISLLAIRTTIGPNLGTKLRINCRPSEKPLAFDKDTAVVSLE